jgi:hypothetical protein
MASFVAAQYRWKVVLKTDGSPSPVTGPSIAAGITVKAKAVDPSTIAFSVQSSGNAFNTNTLTVSDGGKTLSWTSQAPGNTATASVYRKQ